MRSDPRTDTAKRRAAAGVVRRQVHYAGHVQGVGFRYTTQRIAGSYRVYGYVRNLPDGRVLAVVEGEANEVDEFLCDVETALARHIKSADACTSAASGEFDRFEIRA